LSALQAEVTTQSKPFFGPIDNKTWKHFLDSTEIDDKVGGLLRGDPSGSAALEKAGHSFTPAAKVLVERSEFHVKCETSIGYGLSGSRIPHCLGPILDRRIEREAQDIIVAGELLAIYDRALDAKFRRG